MMLYLIIALLFGFGLFLIVTDRLHLPSARAVHVLTSLNGNSVPLSEAIAAPLARPFSRVLPMNAYRKRRMEKELSLAGMEITPEYYVAFAVVMGLYASVPAILLFVFAAVTKNLIFGLFGTVFLFASFLVFWLELHRMGKRAKLYREELEHELPGLTAAVRQGLITSPDIYYVLDHYRSVAGKAMRREMDILLADMATGDREIALNRFEARLSTDHASALVRALIGIDRGENMQIYLDGLDISLREWELNQLKREAAKRPDELRPANLVLLGSMLVLYAILFGTEIWQSVQVFLSA